MSNKLTIFSNGLAQVTRDYASLRVAITCKRPNLADVLASLSIGGNVRMVQPPSYQLPQQGVLVLGTGYNAFRDLIMALKGQKVRVKVRHPNSDAPNGHEIRLLGIQEKETTVGDSVMTEFQVVGVKDAGEICMWSNTEVTSVTPLDKDVMQEVANALSRAATGLKPESIALEFTVENQGGQPFPVQYMVPTSAWQSIYQLRLSGTKARLTYKAKVDNPTDEALNDFYVSCVVGKPNSFQTDLADVRTVQRDRHNLVSDRAQGAVDAQTSLSNLPQRGNRAARAISSVSSMSYGATQLGGNMERLGVAEGVDEDFWIPARGDTADADEGDFAIYTTKQPVTMPPNTSSLITLLDSECNGETLLLFKPEVNVKYPFRAVSFKNTTGFSLDLGVLTVYIDDVFGGQAVMPPTKPNQDRVLPYCIENGVRIIINPPGSENERATRRQRVIVRDGMAEITSSLVADTTYNCRNYRAEPCKMRIEHINQIPGSQVTCDDGEVGALSGGWGITVALTPTEAVDVVVKEHKIEQQSVTLSVDNTFAWLRDTLQVGITADMKVPGQQIQAVQAAYEAFFKAQQNEREAQQEVNIVKGEQARLSELLRTTQQGEQADEWRREQGVNEKKIREFERITIPGLTKATAAARQRVVDEIKKMSFTV